MDAESPAWLLGRGQGMGESTGTQEGCSEWQEKKVILKDRQMSWGSSNSSSITHRAKA